MDNKKEGILEEMLEIIGNIKENNRKIIESELRIYEIDKKLEELVKI